jgi:hypothetical protein
MPSSADQPSHRYSSCRVSPEYTSTVSQGGARRGGRRGTARCIFGETPGNWVRLCFRGMGLCRSFRTLLSVTVRIPRETAFAGLSLRRGKPRGAPYHSPGRNPGKTRPNKVPALTGRHTAQRFPCYDERRALLPSRRSHTHRSGCGCISRAESG